MKTRTRIATLLLAWLVIIPIGVLVPSHAADAAPEEDALLTWQPQRAEIEVGQRISGGSASGGAIVAMAALPTERRLPVPEFEIWPGEDLNQVVNLESFLYITDGFESKSWCWCFFFFRAYFSASPVGSLFEFTETDTGRRTEETCVGPGQPWIPNVTNPYCGKDWEHSSDVTGQVDAIARVLHIITVTGDINMIYPAQSRASDTKHLDVGEVLNVGQTIAVPVLSAPEGSAESGFCSAWGISIVCWLGEQALEAALDAIFAIAPFLREVADFFEGCADAALEAVGGLVDIIREVQEAITNPREFISTKLQEFRDLVAAIQEDPVAFAGAVLADVAQVERLDEEGLANWIGSMICTLAIDYFTGRAADRIIGTARAWLRNRRNTPNPRDIDGNPEFDDDWADDLGDDAYDPDSDLGPGCVANSFPTGTLVLLADNSHLPIDQIRPGDMVQAYNPETGVWTARMVLDQWSYVDTEQMATVTLTDGSAVSATDHHLFWEHSQATWTQAEDLAPTNWVMTPDGPVQIGQVDVWPSNDTLVWELTVDVDHTFAVAAGSHDIVVHNQDVQGTSPADLDANWQTHRANGGTAANWFDSLSADQVRAVQAGGGTRWNRLKNGLRNGGGQHEFFPVSMAVEAKELGLTSADIHNFTISTNDFAGIDPNTGQVFNHQSSTAARRYHEELYAAIRDAGSAQEALDNLNEVNRRWQVSNMPGAGDLFTENQLQDMIANGELTELEAQQIRDNYRDAFDRDATPIGDHDADWRNRRYTDPPRLTC